MYLNGPYVYATVIFLPVEYFRKDKAKRRPKSALLNNRRLYFSTTYCYTLVPTQGVGGCKIVENILVPCRLKYIPRVGG